MFAIVEARKRAIPPPPPFTEVYMKEIEAALNDQSILMNFQFFGKQARAPIKAPSRQLIQRRCHQSMFGRMHDWEITRYEAVVCWACMGTLIAYTEDEGPHDCTTCT